MKFLALHITNQKLSFDILNIDIENLQNIFMEHNLYLISLRFWHKRKMDHSDPYNVFFLLLQIYPCDLTLVLWSRVTFLYRLHKFVEQIILWYAWWEASVTIHFDHKKRCIEYWLRLTVHNILMLNFLFSLKNVIHTDLKQHERW